MTYQEKHNALQKNFTEKFNAYEQLKDETPEEDRESGEFLRVKSEFEKINYEYQEFLMMFKDKNASPEDKLGAPGERCEPSNLNQ